jgi:hypothetical protein
VFEPILGERPIGVTGYTIYDSIRNRILLFGNTEPSLWELPCTPPYTWHQLPGPGLPGPYPSLAMPPVFDPMGDRVVVVQGGLGNFQVWQLPMSSMAWSSVPTQNTLSGWNPAEITFDRSTSASS